MKWAIAAGSLSLCFSLLGTIPALGAGPTNAPIDLTVPSPQEPQTDAGVFDESVIFAPNFALNETAVHLQRI